MAREPTREPRKVTRDVTVIFISYSRGVHAGGLASSGPRNSAHRYTRGAAGGFISMGIEDVAQIKKKAEAGDPVAQVALGNNLASRYMSIFVLEHQAGEVFPCRRSFRPTPPKTKSVWVGRLEPTICSLIIPPRAHARLHQGGAQGTENPNRAESGRLLRPIRGVP